MVGGCDSSKGSQQSSDSAAYEQPVSLIVDDLHHASTSTLDLLAYLSSRLQSSPVALLLLYRSDLASAQLRERVIAMAQAGARSDFDDGTTGGRITLGPLDAVQTETLIASYLALKGAEGKVDPARLAQAAQGHPMRALRAGSSRHWGVGQGARLAEPTARHPLGSTADRLATPAPGVFCRSAPRSERHRCRLGLAAVADTTCRRQRDPRSRRRVGADGAPGSGSRRGIRVGAPVDIHLVGEVSGGRRASPPSGVGRRCTRERGRRHQCGAGPSLCPGWARAARPSSMRGSLRTPRAAAGATAEVLRLLDGALTFAPDTAARSEISLRRHCGKRSALACASGDCCLPGTDFDAPTASVVEATPAAAEDLKWTAEVEHDRHVCRQRGRMPALRPGFWAALVVATLVAAFTIRRQLQLQLQARPVRTLSDSLVVVERSHQRDSVASALSRDLSSPDFLDGPPAAWLGAAWLRRAQLLGRFDDAPLDRPSSFSQRYAGRGGARLSSRHRSLHHWAAPAGHRCRHDRRRSEHRAWLVARQPIGPYFPRAHPGKREATTPTCSATRSADHPGSFRSIRRPPAR